MATKRLKPSEAEAANFSPRFWGLGGNYYKFFEPYDAAAMTHAAQLLATTLHRRARAKATALVVVLDAQQVLRQEL